MLEAVLEYVRQGWSVFPVEPKGKAALVRWAHLQERLPTEDEVREWWTRWPEANIAIVCGRVSRIVVVDVDPKHGGKREGLPPTGCVSKTGSGGSHHVYHYPEGVKVVRNQVNGPDCEDPARVGRDVRGDGGYIIVPPSVHKNGRSYQWERFDLSALGAPPQWALEPIKKKDKDTGREKWLTELITNGTRPGQRNDDLARFAGFLASRSIPIDVGLALSRKWMDGQDSPLHDQEIEVTVRSVYKTEARRNPERVKKSKNKTARKLFKTLTLNQFMRKYGDQEIRWTVEGWLPESTIGFIVSPPGGFKTWMTFDLGTSIASGKPYLGKFPVSEPGPVLIVQQEDFNSQTAERNALVLMNRLGMRPPVLTEDILDVPLMPNDDDLPLHFHAERMLRFDDVELMDALEEYVKEVRPKLVIVDPFYSTVGTEEYMAKAAADMARLKTMRDQYGTSFMMVHHTKKGAEWGRQEIWGSQFLNAFAESLWHVRRPEGEKFNVVHRYFKLADVQDFVKLSFDIRVPDYHYSVKTEEISKDEAERIVSGKSSEKRDKEVYPKGAAKQVLEALAVKSMTVQELAKELDSTIPKVTATLRRLLAKGDVREDVGGLWAHTVPDLT